MRENGLPIPQLPTSRSMPNSPASSPNDQPHSQSPDDGRFVALLTECQAQLRMYVRALMPGEQNAADVIQQTNATIWEKRESFEFGTNFTAWAMAIARYEVLNEQKRQARSNPLQFSTELAETFASEIDSDRFSSKAEQLQYSKREALQHCVSALDQQQQQLLEYRYRNDQRLNDLAQRLERPVGSLKVSLHRIRQRLAKCIELRLASTGDNA